MTDAPPPNGAPNAAQPPLVINGQYVKDLSFEVPGAPEIFRHAGETQDIPIGIDVKTRHLDGRTYEVVLHLRAEAKTAGRTGFILEVAYGAVCTLNVPDQHLHPVMLVEVPRQIFPFVRNIVADLTRDGGFPPLLITPIDFGELYRQRLAQQAAAAQPGAEAASSPTAGS